MLEQSRDAVCFPPSDDQPMSDSDVNRVLMEFTEQALQDHFRHDPMVYVSADLILYYNEVNGNDRVAPDVFFVRGVPNHLRDSYKLWTEKVCPQVVFEFVSMSSRDRDPVTKVRIYQTLGVKEYYVFDAATGRLRCFLRRRGRLVEVVVGTSVLSRELGLELRVHGNILRLHSPGAEEPLPIHPELRQRFQEQAERARLAEERAVEAEDRAVEAEDRAVEAEDRAVEAEDRALEAEDRAREGEERERILLAQLEALRRQEPT